MTSLVLDLLMNGLVAMLLVLTIGYCWVLNKRIRVLQDSRSELAQLIKHFDESTQRASTSIITLQTTSKRLTDQINERIERANFMADDLAFLIDKSNKLADKLEASLADGRKKQASPLAPTMQARRPEVRGEEALVKKPVPARPTLEPLAVAAPPAPARPKPVAGKQPFARAATPKETMSMLGSAKAKTAASLESVLERIASRNHVEGPPREEENPAAAIASARQREQAEELLALVRANRQV